MTRFYAINKRTKHKIIPGNFFMTLIVISVLQPTKLLRDKFYFSSYFAMEFRCANRYLMFLFLCNILIFPTKR